MPLSTPIITKVAIPARPPDLLRRERLIDLLHQYASRKLILVSAPPGYGKTSLLLDFAHETDLAACWYTLDATDRDPGVFVEHLIASLAQRFPDFGQEARRLLAGDLAPGDDSVQVMGALINEMVRTIPEWFVIVLDDFHLVDGSPGITRLLDTLLKYQPEHCCLIIASRSIPSNPLLRNLAVRREMAHVGQEELRFTMAEACALLANSHSVSLSLHEIERLAVESEGWITGILLTMDSPWRTMLDVGARVRASDRPLYDYLDDEVLSRQEPRLRAFLLASSTMEEMSPALCQQALGLSDADEWLHELERQRLFVECLDREQGLFRYHALFRAFLQKRARHEMPEPFCGRHRQAATWFKACGETERAAYHYLAAGSLIAAGRMMDGVAQDLFRAGRLETLIRWAERLPTDVIQATAPRLALYAAEAAVDVGRLEDASTWIDIAAEAFQTHGQTDQEALVLVARSRACYQQGLYPEAMRWAQQAQALLDSQSLWISPAAAEVRRLQGLCALQMGRPEQAQSCFESALEVTQILDSAYHQALIEQGMAICLYSQGQLPQALQIGRTAVEQSRLLGSPSVLAEALNNLTGCLCSSGEYAEALNGLQEALGLARMTGHRSLEADVLVNLGRVVSWLGDSLSAVDSLTQGLEIARDLDLTRLIIRAKETLAIACLCTDDAHQALQMAAEALEMAQQQGGPSSTGRFQATLGLAQIEAGHPDLGIATIRRAVEQLESTDAAIDASRVRFIFAYALHVVGRGDEALDALVAALTPHLNGAPFHHLSSTILLPLPLLERAAGWSTPVSQWGILLDEFRALQRAARPVLDRWEKSAVSQPSSLHIYGFGVGQVERDGVPVPSSAWQTSTARFLLFYLLESPPRSRNHIVAAVWPDLNTRRLSGTFHNTKGRIQRAIGINPISYSKGFYTIRDDLDIWYDVREFEQLLLMARQSSGAIAVRYLQRAIALYTDDFLTGCYAEWCMIRRESLREQYLSAVQTTAKWLIKYRQTERAIDILHAGLQVDRLRESFYRQLMQAYAMEGNSADATAQYRCCKRVLERDLDVCPEPDTEELYRAIREGRFVAPKP